MDCRFLTLVAFVLVGTALMPAPAAPLPCPAVGADGKAQPIVPATIASVTRREDEQIEPDLAQVAIEIVGRFEAGGADPWSNVSGHEQLSLGFMQWNWGTRSLVRDFFSAVDREAIGLATEGLRTDLATFKDFADDLNNHDKEQLASAVIESWTHARPGDPLEARVRTSVRAGLTSWLETDALRKAQMGIVSTQLKQAFALARAWRRDRAAGGGVQEIDSRLVAYFFDLVTFNGGRKGLWVPHVRAFRAQYANDPRASVDAVADWLISCKDFVNPDSRDKRLYAIGDAERSANYWKSQIAADRRAFTEDQIDLLVLGLLRAQVSNGANAPRGFPGIYQADVLTRRGVIALGSGFIRGSATPVRLFQ